MGHMNWSRRELLKAALALPGAAFLANYRALAAPYKNAVKITAIKTMGLDNLGDGCLIKIETDAGLVGYGEAGKSAAGVGAAGFEADGRAEGRSGRGAAVSNASDA